MHAAGDDVAGGFVQIVVEEFGEFQELRPQDLVHHRPGHADHDGGGPLAGETVRIEIVAAAEGDEELALPRIVDLELVFDRRLGRDQEP